METQPAGAESIHLDVVKRMFAAFDVDLAETRNERTNELLASMMAGLLSGEGSIPADLVRRALAAYGVDVDEMKFKRLNTGSPHAYSTPLLVEAVFDGDGKLGAALLAVGCNVNADVDIPETPIHWESTPTTRTETALHFAAAAGNVGMVRMLLAAGAHVNKQPSPALPTAHDRFSPLALAAGNEDPACARLLLAAGADVDGGLGEHPLFQAVRHGRLRTLRMLLAAGANTMVVSKGMGETPLQAAVDYEQLAVLQFFLDAGFDVNERSPPMPQGDGMSPLETAIYCGHRNCLQPLLRAGATIDFESLARVHLIACENGEENDSAWRYMDRVQEAGGYDQLVLTYRRVLTAPRSCLVKYLELRFGRPAPADLVPVVLGFWKPPGGG